MFRSSNPVVRRLENQGFVSAEDTASYKGLALKSLYFILLTIVAASITFFSFVVLLEVHTNLLIGLLIAGPIIAFICAMIASFIPSATAIAGSIYAVMEGMIVGVVSALVDYLIPGVVFAALAATLGVFLIMMVLYATGAIRVGNRFRRFMISALLGILFFNIVVFIIGLFNGAVYDTIYGNGAIALIISVVMVIVASLMILFDLDRMTRIVQNGMDKKYEWLGAFGLTVTIIWLYVEFLRLFLIIASRRR